MLRYIVSLTALNGFGCDAVCVMAGMGGDWSKHLDMHFMFSLAGDGCGQHMLK
jgi:hypothetical protein